MPDKKLFLWGLGVLVPFLVAALAFNYISPKREEAVQAARERVFLQEASTILNEIQQTATQMQNNAGEIRLRIEALERDISSLERDLEGAKILVKRNANTISHLSRSARRIEQRSDELAAEQFETRSIADISGVEIFKLRQRIDELSILLDEYIGD